MATEPGATEAAPQAARRSSSRSMLAVNALVLASLGASFASHVAIAAFFGLSRQVDAYYAALVLPNLFVLLCIDYIGKNFLPIFASARRDGFARASELTSSIVTIVAILAALVALVLVIAGRPLLRALLPGFSAGDVEIASRYLSIMAPTVVLTAVTSFHQYVCQHDEDYTAITAIKMAVPLASFAAILTAGPFVGAYALPIGFTLGHLVTAVLMARRARYDYSPRIGFREEWERKIFTNSAIVMGSGFVARTRGLVATYLSSQLGSGAVAALALGQRLVDPIHRTAFIGIKMMMFTRVARLHAESDTGEIARLYSRGLSASFLVLAPLLWWMALDAEAIVRVVFERGAFDAGMTALVVLALIGFAPSVVFVGMNTLLSNAFYAMGRVLVPAIVMPVGTVVYLLVAPAVYRPLGVLGLALSASLVAVVVFALLLHRLARRVPALRASGVLRRLSIHAALSGAAATAAQAVPRTGAGEAVDAVLALVLGSALYFGVLMLLRDRTLADVRVYLSRAFPSRAPAARRR
ncbi:MAG TPA: lipid II flippase MurJ [Gammaproteobacteria bacterium]